ncbi:DUF6928 family protein [Cumulibacter soli]|uniref:DUF6928 family protein n=1 Tax=Cumulibacter soli TaxID=2546344 RepID=UPI00106732C2|nr:hypothetical protein [Cumulibacter soli]
MGLSFSFLAFSRAGTVDLTRPGSKADADAVVRRLFPRTAYRLAETRPLLGTAFPARGTLAVGAFLDGVLIATRDAQLYDPAILHARYLKLTEWPDLRLLTSDSTTSMVAYGRWLDGALQRRFSVNHTAGVHRDSGTPEPFEADIPLAPEHWLELANAALASILRLDGDTAPATSASVPWDQVQLHEFTRA